MTDINPFLLLALGLAIVSFAFFTLMAMLNHSEDLGLIVLVCGLLTMFLLIACGASWHQLHYPTSETINIYKTL